MDIYFEKNWCEYCAKRSSFDLDHVHFQCKEGEVDYFFLLRPIEIKGKRFPFFDIMTPHGFSGPFITACESTPECQKAVADKFIPFFDRYCHEHNIIAEYVQFNPWIGNHELFQEVYSLKLHSKIIGIDLTKNDIFMNEFSSMRRRTIRSAMKQGVKIHYDYSGTMTDEFIRLYRSLVERRQITSAYYLYSTQDMRNVFQTLDDRIYYAYAMYEGKCAAICLLLQSEDYLHYELACRDYDLSFTNAASLLIYEVAQKAKTEGKKAMILGGGDGELMRFKLNFTHDCIFDYYVGTRIRNTEVYRELVSLSGNENSEFFPQYYA